jgi:hypothetical protein
MEAENNTEPRRNVFLTVLISLVSLFIIYFTVMSILSPARKLEEIRNEFGAKPSEKEEPDQKILTDAAYLKLLKEKSFLQSRILMAGTDSIYLTINLADSSANLEISGVAVHKAKMKDVKVSRILMDDNENAVLSMLAKPFSIEYANSSIKKEPVMIKMAPKDTSEYKPDVMPDTSITEPVNYILVMNGGLRIYVYQEENVKFEDKLSQIKFDLTDRIDDTWSALKRIIVFKVPEYHPFIKMKLPRSDAKIIYRAIPKNGQIAVYY